jgi:hypothetical protein
MNTIHKLSNITPHPDFDLFGVPPTQLTIERDVQSEHRPISVLNSTSIIQFVIHSAIDEYIQLRDTLFKIKLKINLTKKDRTNVVEDDWKKVAPVNYLLQSMFSYINVEINNKPITMAPHTYAYKAYFDAILGFTKDARTSFLSAAGFVNTTDQTTFTEAHSKLIRPTEIKTTGEGKSTELMGKFHLPLAFQPRALLGGVTLKLTLVPNDSKFYMWSTEDNIVPTVEFEDATLFLHKSKVIYPIVDAHTAALTKGSAKYPMCRGHVKAFNINTGTIDTIIDNAVNGVLPRRIFVALVSNEAFSGKLSKNPFEFKTYNLNYIAAHIDGKQYPIRAYTPDFEKGIYNREYLGLFESLNQITTDSTISLTPKEWANGNTIYGFNFAPDLGDDCSKMGFSNPIRHGSLKLELKFSSALTETISVLVYCEYDSILEIDINREVQTDYM